MENILSNITTLSGIKEILSYFSCEVILTLGVILNFLLFIFKKRDFIRTISTILTGSIFGINIFLIAVTLIGNYIGYNNFDFSNWREYFDLSGYNIFLKLLLNAFMLMFTVINYKFIRRYRFKTPIINAISILLVMCGCLMIECENHILVYLLLETTALFTYKYASNMRIKKYSVFSSDFIVLSGFATIIFIAFYLMSLKIYIPAQLSIINVCISIAVLMKIGIFPIYNYLIIRKCKTNFPFSILVFSYLPLIGVIAFNKMSTSIFPTDEIYQISMIVYLVTSMITFSFYASKQKNLVKFYANFSYFINAFCILNIVYFQADLRSIFLSVMCAFGLLGLYSLSNILKLNLGLEKLYIANLKGIFLENRLFAILYSSILLMLIGLIPSGVMVVFLKIIKNIYIFDKTGFLTVCGISILILLIMFNSLKIVQNIFTFERKSPCKKLTKRTTLNYVVPVVIIIALLINLLL